MSIDTELAPAPAGDNKHRFEFSGSAGEMWPIIFKNLLLNIITLSFYRFWGRTNIRRYIWSNIRFMGDSLEYTGTGGEMFKGFILAAVFVFTPLTAVIFYAQYLTTTGQQSLGSVIMLVAIVFVYWLLPFAIYRTLKYRLSRTRWRGVRAAQLQSGVAYAFMWLGYMLLIGISFGLATPYVQNQLFAYESRNRRFGSQSFEYDAPSGPLYASFFIGLVISIGAGVVILPAMTASMQTSPGMFLLLYIAFIVVVSLAFAYYSWKVLEHFLNNTHYSNARFEFTGSFSDFVTLLVGNILIAAVTLGIAFPITQMRMIRFVVQNTVAEGDIDLAAISQTADDEPEFGEGLAEGFDMGTI